ncbi:GlsB/YeaQ/YmgE family stress response membrane protein [Thalassoroseus pseudoceratinae]|uniref:GlsB/YeaQ/YmgE family stress response membrane protein n=1 Tax=Thalassoroseus pseudoceratinae TaxID=2713176 RepID=UPI0014229B8C|nr:GlsB/YeaQ/YmgE family stress response membrane protein [Thalassoroseus pseudoceratinae]
MAFLYWAIFGLIAGALGKLLMPGDDPGGCLVTILLGVAGAFVGGFIGTRLGWGTVDGFDIRSFAMAIGGTMLLLLGYRILKKTD